MSQGFLYRVQQRDNVVCSRWRGLSYFRAGKPRHTLYQGSATGYPRPVRHQPSWGNRLTQRLTGSRPTGNRSIEKCGVEAEILEEWSCDPFDVILQGRVRTSPRRMSSDFIALKPTSNAQATYTHWNSMCSRESDIPSTVSTALHLSSFFLRTVGNAWGAIRPLGLTVLEVSYSVDTVKISMNISIVFIIIIVDRPFRY